MNLTQRQNVLNLIQKFEKIDYVPLLVAKYKNQGSLDGIVIGDYSITDALSLAKRVVSQLRDRLNADDWQILPIVQNMPEYGQVNIEVSLTEMTLMHYFFLPAS